MGYLPYQLAGFLTSTVCSVYFPATSTTQKTDMEPEIQLVEEEFFFGNHDFQIPCSFFGGVGLPFFCPGENKASNSDPDLEDRQCA